MTDNIIQSKTFNFAVRIINLYKFLVEEKKEYTLSKQLLRSGTSIGANTEAAIGGYSKKDFAAKLSIAYKEAHETHYWLRLLKETGYINDNEFISLIEDCDEILKIIFSMIRSTNE